MKKYPILLHIPHASLTLPKPFWNHTLISKPSILSENKKMTDRFVDRLVRTNKVYRLRFPKSRLFCDVERFCDDNEEAMAKLGMGVIYQTTSQGIPFFRVTAAYRKTILQNDYFPHHQKLNTICQTIIDSNGWCLLIDLHSFQDDVVHDLFQISKTPDICIGTDPFYTPPFLKEFTQIFFQKQGYQVAFDTPYQGTMIPNCFFRKKEKHFYSIMIEINKRIYIDRKDDFLKLQRILTEYIESIHSLTTEKNVSTK